MAPGVSADGSKLCPGCHKILETAMFGTNRRRPDGLAYYCKECFRSIHARSYRKRKAAAGLTVREPRVSPPGHRWCPDCEAHVPLTDFGLNATSNSGLSGYCLKHQAIRS